MDNKVLQLGVFAVAVAGYVLLAIKGQATAEYVALIGPVLGAAFLMSHLGRQDDVLTQINENTNGVLKDKIRQGVQEALENRNNRPSGNS